MISVFPAMSALPVPLLFRSYQPHDREGCAAVFRSNVPRFFAESERGSFLGYLTDPTSAVWVIEDGGAIVGVGGIYRRANEGRLCWGMVAAQRQGNGIGGELLRRRVSALFADPEIFQVALATSQRSAGYFRRFGFVERARRIDGFGPGLDRVDMVLARDVWSRFG